MRKIPPVDINGRSKRRRKWRYGKDYCPQWGKPLSRMPSPKELTRFLSFIDTKTAPGHWLWTGRLDDKGYGQFWFDGRAHWAHRISAQIFVGLLHFGMQAAHLHDRCPYHHCVHPFCLGQDHISSHASETNRRRDDSV